MTNNSISNNKKEKMGFFKLLKEYWILIKSKQTFLLVITGWAGFSSTRCPIVGWETSLAVFGSLFLAISGCTIFNMVYDRDIDSIMPRTIKRPLSTGTVSVPNAILVASIVTGLGVGWAFTIDALYGWIILAGLFLDAILYTVVLKRYTPYSIIWGGLSVGMPILAGRSLGLGYIDLIGVLLALAIVFWIPTHIMTFSIKYADQYEKAGIPTFPSAYGVDVTRKIIAGSTVLASFAMITAARLIEVQGYYLMFLILCSIGLVGLATVTVLGKSLKLNFSLFKAASLYMLGSMLLLIFAI
ncbi:MAG: protoheme IX farnesyltransferase [Vulcanibacillus sp.]